MKRRIGFPPARNDAIYKSFRRLEIILEVMLTIAISGLSSFISKPTAAALLIKGSCMHAQEHVC